MGAGKLIPESDLTEKLLTNDFPEDRLVMEPDRIDTSMLFKEALKVDLISLSSFFCLKKIQMIFSYPSTVRDAHFESISILCSDLGVFYCPKAPLRD